MSTARRDIHGPAKNGTAGREEDVALSRAKEKLIHRLRNARMRPREGLVLVEGPRAAADVVDAGTAVRFALVSPSSGLVDRRDEGGIEGGSTRGRAGAYAGPGFASDFLLRRIEGSGAEIVEVGDAELESVSDTESPQGVLLVCEEPEFSLEKLLAVPRARLLVLDGIQDPGNAGTLVRAARAFGLEGVVFLDGSVDPWNPKAVRAAAGASFHLPVLKVRWEELDGALSAGEISLLVADAGGGDVASVDPGAGWALVVGSEGSGARSEVRDAAAAVVSVPMPGGAESLNAGVAGSILLYALTVEEPGPPTVGEGTGRGPAGDEPGARDEPGPGGHGP